MERKMQSVFKAKIMNNYFSTKHNNEKKIKTLQRSFLDINKIHSYFSSTANFVLFAQTNLHTICIDQIWYFFLHGLNTFCLDKPTCFKPRPNLVLSPRLRQRITQTFPMLTLILSILNIVSCLGKISSGPPFKLFAQTKFRTISPVTKLCTFCPDQIFYF